MPNKTLISNFSTMKDNNTLTYDTHSISTVFKSFFSNLARYLHIILPNPQDKYNLESDINYSRFTLTDDFCLNKNSENKVIKIIQKIEISMATGIDGFLDIFYKMGLNFYQGLYLKSVTYQYPMEFFLMLSTLQN